MQNVTKTAIRQLLHDRDDITIIKKILRRSKASLTDADRNHWEMLAKEELGQMEIDEKEYNELINDLAKIYNEN